MPNRFNKYKVNSFLSVIFFIPILKMGSFEQLFPVLDKVFDVLKVLDFFLLGLLFFLKVKHGERIVFDKILLISILYSMLIIAVTVSNGGSFFNSLVYCSSLLLVYFWLFLFVKRKTDLRLIVALFSLIMMVDIMTKILFPKGMYTIYTSEGAWMSDENWFLGYKNNYFPIVGFFFVVEEYNRILNKTKGIWKYFFYILCLVEVFFVSKSGTTIVATSMIILYFLIKDTALLKSKHIIIGYYLTIVAILIVFVLFSNNNGIFLLIGSFFSKDYSVTERFFLWKKAIEAFLQNPFFGLGLSFGNSNHPLSNWDSHNRYLWCLATVGIVGSVLLIALLCSITRKIFNNYNWGYNRFLGWITFVVMVTWQVEVYSNVAMYVFAIMIFSYYSCISNEKRFKY